MEGLNLLWMAIREKRWMEEKNLLFTAIRKADTELWVCWEKVLILASNEQLFIVRLDLSI